MSKFTNWSFSQINDFKNLHQASSISNNNNLKLYSNSSIITIIYFNYDEIQEASESNSNYNANCTNIHNTNNINNYHNTNVNNNSNSNQPANKSIKPIKSESKKEKEEKQQRQKITLNYFLNNVNIPFFNDGIGSLQFLNKGKFFIVGNKNSQMFYIYENFPASNLKHDTDMQAKRSVYRNKISYSVFRGITKGVINNIDLSSCNKYLIISSNKGTFHLFAVPNKNEQINENSSLFDYEYYNESNNKIFNAVNIEKIKYSGFIENCGNYVYKTASKLLSGCKVDLDEIDAEVKKHIVKTNFAKKLNANLLLNFSEYDCSVNLHLIHSEKSEKMDDNGICNFNFGGLNGYLNPGFSSGVGNSSLNNHKTNLNSASANNKKSNKFGNGLVTGSSTFFGDASSGNNNLKKDKIFLIKKIDINESLIKINSNNNHIDNRVNVYSEKLSEINSNYKNLLHKMKQNYSYKTKNNLKQFIDWETTTRNFPTLQTHPLFTFNFYKKQRSSLNNFNSNPNFNNNINNSSNNYFEINANNNFNSGANLNSNKNSGFNINANNINNLIQNKNSRNNHNDNSMNNLNSNNSNSNFQIIQNIGSISNTNTNYNNNSNLNQGLNSYVNLSSCGNHKEDSNSENLEIIIDNDQKEYVNIENCKNKEKNELKNIAHEEIENCDDKNNNYLINNKKENVKKIKNNKLKNNTGRKINNIDKEKIQNINLKFKKQLVFDNSISINSSSYSLGSSMEKNKIKILIDKNRSESKESNSQEEANKSSLDENNLANTNINFKQNEKTKEAKVNNLKAFDFGHVGNRAEALENENPKALLESQAINNKHVSEEIKAFSKTTKLRNTNLDDNMKFLVNNNQKAINIINNDDNENLNDNEFKNSSSISNRSGNNERRELVQPAIFNSNASRANNCNNTNTISNRILTYKKSFDSSIHQNYNFKINNNINTNNNNSNLNNSAIDNLIAEKYICNDLEYFEINFNLNKQIQKSDFFLDNYMGPKLIINPFDVYNSNSYYNSRKNTRENIELRQDSVNNNLFSRNKENSEMGSICVNMNNIYNNSEDDFFNNKELILKKKIQDAINSNIMDKIVSSSDTIVKFSGEIRIDEDYIKK